MYIPIMIDPWLKTSFLNQDQVKKLKISITNALFDLEYSDLSLLQTAGIESTSEVTEKDDMWTMVQKWDPPT